MEERKIVGPTKVSAGSSYIKIATQFCASYIPFQLTLEIRNSFRILEFLWNFYSYKRRCDFVFVQEYLVIIIDVHPH